MVVLREVLNMLSSSSVDEIKEYLLSKIGFRYNVVGDYNVSIIIDHETDKMWDVVSLSKLANELGLPSIFITNLLRVALDGVSDVCLSDLIKDVDEADKEFLLNTALYTITVNTNINRDLKDVSNMVAENIALVFKHVYETNDVFRNSI